MYVYVHMEHESDFDVFTVGFYNPDGMWMPEGDYGTRNEAAARVHYLNGGSGPR